MVAVQMRNENMIDPASPDFIARQLHLSSLSTIDKEQLVVQCNYLGGRVTIIGRKGRIIS